MRLFVTPLRPAFAFALAALLPLGCATAHQPPTAPEPHPDTTVYVIRHAEKAPSDGDNPSLSEAGRVRAQALRRALGSVKLQAVFATEYRRTQETVAPTAEAVGLPVQVVSAGRTRALADRIKTRYRGQSVLVAGHSNTVPELLADLGVTEPVVVEHHDWGDLFVVTLHQNGGVELKRDHFGSVPAK
jgi:broad specificity phosphatase PhoE